MGAVRDPVRDQTFIVAVLLLRRRLDLFVVWLLPGGSCRELCLEPRYRCLERVDLGEVKFLTHFRSRYLRESDSWMFVRLEYDEVTHEQVTESESRRENASDKLPRTILVTSPTMNVLAHTVQYSENPNKYHVNEGADAAWKRVAHFWASPPTNGPRVEFERGATEFSDASTSAGDSSSTDDDDAPDARASDGLWPSVFLFVRFPRAARSGIVAEE